MELPIFKPTIAMNFEIFFWESSLLEGPDSIVEHATHLTASFRSCAEIYHRHAKVSHLFLFCRVVKLFQSLSTEGTGMLFLFCDGLRI
jgi:hypothetical protein